MFHNYALAMNDDLWGRVCRLGIESWGVPDTHQRNRNNISDLLRALPVKVSVKDGRVCI